ncbi:MAG: 50S ribosomal protein L29 [Patescibacteria group bacterium]
MKSKEIQELKNKSHEELSGMLHESREKLRVLRFDLASGKVKNVSSIHALKKNIARMMTFLNQPNTS